LEIGSGLVSSAAEYGLAADERGRDADGIREAGAHRGVLAGHMNADWDRVRGARDALDKAPGYSRVMPSRPASHVPLLAASDPCRNGRRPPGTLRAPRDAILDYLIPDQVRMGFSNGLQRPISADLFPANASLHPSGLTLIPALRIPLGRAHRLIPRSLTAWRICIHSQTSGGRLYGRTSS
jgi:hypothetical protein